MLFPAASFFLKALGWALLNSIWQFAACWLVYYLFTLLFKQLAAAAKHTVALGLLCGGVILFIVELTITCYSASALTLLPEERLVIYNTAWYDGWHTAGNYIDAIMPYWSLLYIGAVILLFIKLGFFVRRTASLPQKGITRLSADWRLYIKKVMYQLGIQQEVKAFLSIHIDTPQVMGFFKPVILLPAACLTNLSIAQLEAVLLHELVHVKRNDYLVNLFIASVEILFFFNPFVKQMTAHIRKEREYSCDDMVMQFQYQPGDYAAALLTLEKNRSMPVLYGIAASGKNEQQLLTRIKRIVGIETRPVGFYQAATVLGGLLVIIIIAGIIPVKLTADERVRQPAISADNLVQHVQYNSDGTTQLKFNIDNFVTRPGTNVKSADAQLTAGRKLNHDDKISSPGFPADTQGDPDDEVPVNEILNAASQQPRDFTLASREPAGISQPDLPTIAEEPYVPATSFSFQLTQDTGKPKVKGETYSERTAREAMLKTQQALMAINWKKIEKELKYNRKDLLKLKNALTLQLRQIDWQKINIDARTELKQQQFEQLQEAVKQTQVIKQYQQSEAYSEAIQKQLTEQEQVIKASSLRMQETQKAIQEQQKKLQLEMKKHRIIYI